MKVYDVSQIKICWKKRANIRHQFLSWRSVSMHPSTLLSSNENIYLAYLKPDQHSHLHRR
jgi:hypothetical protein